jgi:uncharacterized protein with ParB-like and HNH nuclease domain
MKIESQDTDIESLLDGSFFHIPRFQRPYSWDDDNINEFWNDLIANKGEDYFIGSMVVYKKSKQQFGVVDGQQRLTTITILLCVIRDSFSSLDCADYALGIHQLIERKNRSNKDEYVLKTETSFPYFQENIQKYNEEADVEIDIHLEEKNLENAHKSFIKLVSSVITSVDDDASISEEDKNKNKINKLIEIRDTVLNLNLIFVTLENEDDAYLIFETLNTRGKDLALTDLVKNHFSKHLKAKGDVDHARIKWEKMLETIHNSSTDISTDYFLYHFWASRYDSTPLKKLFPKFKKRVTKNLANEYLDNLVSDSKIYRSILEPSYGWSKNEIDVSRSLSMLKIFKLSQATPAVLSLVRCYKDKKIKYAKLRDSIKAIEKFHFSFTAITSSRSSGGISFMYTSFAERLFEAKTSKECSDEIQILVKKLQDRVPSFDEFKVAFKEIVYTNSKSKQKNLVRYILRGFAEHYSYKYPVDYDELTIEHIHPQSKSKNEKWSESVGCIGNLLYIDQKMNEKLSSKNFQNKVKILLDDGYDLPEFIINSDTWSPGSVLENTFQMAEVAYNKIWKI